MRGLPHYQLPSLEALRDLALETARVVNPDVEVVGISVNTAALNDAAAMLDANATTPEAAGLTNGEADK